MENILSQLNEAQQEAVKNIDGPMMVIAGAGSGKTRVLTYRIAYMIEQGINPFNILSLTFTNKAAEEMKERVIQLLGDSKGKYVWMGTFHSIFSKILHIESEWLGFSPNFSIYDTEDCKTLIKNILKENNLDSTVYKPNSIISTISSAKTSLLMPEEYCNNEFIEAENRMKGMPELGNIYRMYQQRLKKSDSMDFDDLLVNMYILLRDFPSILHKYQHKFRYILVDEYQDTNNVQYQIIRKLSAAYENICVVGDDAQSIYAFRGANIDNMLNFKTDYPDCEIYKLEQNYRSTKNIITAANSVIARNKHQIPKLIWTANQEGDKIKVSQLESDTYEAIHVAKNIVELKEKHNLKFEDFAILYRTNTQSRPFEEAFRRLTIPYRIYGGISFYSRKEIKDTLAYFRLSVNFYNEEALRRIINYPKRGIGTDTMEKIIVCANQHQVNLWDVIENPLQYALNISTKTLNTLESFVNKIKSFNAQLYTLDAFQLGKHIADSSGITQELRSQIEEKERYENLGELLNALQNFTERPADTRIDMETGEDLQEAFPSLDLFLNEVALYTDADKEETQNQDNVKLMTMHAAKGLEFPCVFLVGIEENIMPSFRISSSEELEEERRLFYVAITRAQKILQISCAQTRNIFGNFNFSNPSPFINDINKEVIETTNNNNETTLKEKKKYYYTNPQLSEHSLKSKNSIRREIIAKKPSLNQPIIKKENLPDIKVDDKLLTAQTSEIGMKVFHSNFGIGEILEINVEDNRVIIQFDKVGKKTLLYNFAKLKKIL